MTVENTLGALPAIYVTLGLAIATMFLIAIGLGAQGWLRMAGKPSRTASHAMVCIVMLLFAAIVANMALVSAALSHGMDDMSSSYAEIIRGLKNSPKEDRLPENLHGTVIIYYRFSCEDCQAVYQDLHETLDGLPDVYFVSTRSEQGKALLELYPTSRVPSGIYIMRENEAAANSEYPTVDFVAYALDKEDEYGNVMLDIENLNKLLEWQKNGL